MFKMFNDWSARRLAVRELSRLSDRSLADLGIARVDIATVASLATARPDEEIESLAGPAAPFALRDADGARPASFHPASLAA